MMHSPIQLAGHLMTLSVNEIEALVQFNFAVICELQKKVEELIELDTRIIQRLSQKKQSSKVADENHSPQEKFIRTIFGKVQFNYMLALESELAKPLFKNKNFNIEVGLYDLYHNPIENINQITLQLCVYCGFDQPKLLTVTRRGKPIIRGHIEIQLWRGKAQFRKISMMEVSSKFQNQVVTLVIFPKLNMRSTDNLVNQADIRPLVIRNLHVFSKKQR